MKTAILIQARLSSSRYPKKMLENLNGITLLEYVYQRCKESKIADKVIVITSDEKSDDDLYYLCLEKNIPVFRGELDNVLQRYIAASEYFDIEFVCRICGDSPFVDIDALDNMLNILIQDDSLDYLTVTNTLNGFVSEVFTLDVLKKIRSKNLSADDKEHVTKYIRDNMTDFKVKMMNLDLRLAKFEKYTLTIDYPDDLLIAKDIVKHLNGFKFSSDNILTVLKKIGESNEL